MTTTKTTPKGGEKAVRDYLSYLEDPSEFVNKKLIDQLQRKFDKEKDPVGKLALWQQITEAKIPDGGKVEAAFIKNVKAWSENNGIAVDTLIEVFSVPRGVLKEAGFPIRSHTYKARVTGSAVRAWIAEQQGPFLISDVVEMTGASDAGARNVIREMLAEEVVEALPKQTVKFGRAPIYYQNVQKNV